MTYSSLSLRDRTAGNERPPSSHNACRNRLTRRCGSLRARLGRAPSRTFRFRETSAPQQKPTKFFTGVNDDACPAMCNVRQLSYPIAADLSESFRQSCAVRALEERIRKTNTYLFVLRCGQDRGFTVDATNDTSVGDALHFVHSPRHVLVPEHTSFATQQKKT
jgi:hypothetical protein